MRILAGYLEIEIHAKGPSQMKIYFQSNEKFELQNPVLIIFS